MLSNDQIWENFTAGDEAAFKQLMLSNYADLFNYGIRFSKDKELVKDCIQDLFLNLWFKKENISKTVNVKAYLFSSLRRAIVRKVNSSKNSASSNTINEEAVNFNLQVSIEQEFILNESTLQLANQVAAALEKLPARQQEVIYLKYFHNLTRDEISKAMNITPQTVSNLLQIALKNLQSGFNSSFKPNLLFLILPLIVEEIIF